MGRNKEKNAERGGKKEVLVKKREINYVILTETVQAI